MTINEVHFSQNAWNVMRAHQPCCQNQWIQLPQERIQVVRSNKVARKRLTKSNGTPAMDPDIWILIWRVHSHIVVKKTFAYADIQTNEEMNKTQLHQSRLSLDLQTLFTLSMIIMWITIIYCFVFKMCITFISSFDGSHVSIESQCIHTCMSL